MSSHSTPLIQSVNHVNNTHQPTNGFTNTSSSNHTSNFPIACPALNGHANGNVNGSANAVASGSGSGNTQPPLSWIERGSINRKRKWTSMGFNEPEQAVMERTTMGFHLALASDQVSTLFPEKPVAFVSYEDVVEKLVPYHIWQVCDEELDGQEGEVKRKQREEREAEATSIVSRMTNIQHRLVQARLRSGLKSSPAADLISLIRESTSVLRDEVSNVQRDYRRLNAERDAIEIAAKRREEQAAYQRNIEATARSNEERAKAAQAAARVKEAQARQAALSAKASPAAASKTPARATPKLQSSPAPTPTPHHQTPTPSRGRGRPRGGGGLREQAMTHVAQSATPTSSKQASVSATASPSPGPASPAGSSTATPTPSVGHPAASGSRQPARSGQGDDAANILDGAMLKGPVNISFPITSIPDLLKAGILSKEKKPAVKPPAWIASQHQDPSLCLVSLDLSKFSPGQLAVLSKILKVQPNRGNANGKPAGGAGDSGASQAPSGGGTG